MVSDEAVERASGKGWEEWFSILDAAGANGWKHPEIARWLADEHGVSAWWAQSVTVAYEQARGLRAPHERPDGFSVSATKTVAVPVRRLFEAFADEGLREHWLTDDELEVGKTTPGRSLRARWGDGPSRVSVGFEPKGEAKSQVAVQHERLPDAEAAQRMKSYWRARLTALKQLLEA